MALEEAVLKETGLKLAETCMWQKAEMTRLQPPFECNLEKSLSKLCLKCIEMQKNLLETASKHVDTVILEYTHLQAAQPVTFAHYLLSHFQALQRDLERLQAAYGHVNQCPLGSGALATTSFPINRKRTAELLRLRQSFGELH